MNTTKVTATESVLKSLDRLISDLEALYKDIHAHPELSMQETRTAGLASQIARRDHRRERSAFRAHDGGVGSHRARLGAQSSP
jgi:metal-dependent amidase/aminoacylase/carboxypeptidase family protein